MCWIDIEQFRGMLHKDKAQREEKCKDIKNKYLNRKYFFGPDSPATKEEQEQVTGCFFLKKIFTNYGSSDNGCIFSLDCINADQKRVTVLLLHDAKSVLHFHLTVISAS